MFQKQKPESKQSNLQGEDFDIFPTLDEFPQPSKQEVKPQAAEPEDDPGPTDFQKKIASIPEKKWNLYQLLIGAVLGIICGLLITLGNEALGGSTGLIIAFGIAVILPSFLERQAARKMGRMRIAMCVAMMFAILAMIGLNKFAFFD